MTDLDVVTFGEAMVLFVAETSGDLAGVERFTRRMAGCETNVSVGLARLGMHVGWATIRSVASSATRWLGKASIACMSRPIPTAQPA
jgi:sugar/nucleoside kinase (ribokinase family)